MNTVFHKNYTGDKRYELSNHLGNVLQIITDDNDSSDGGTVTIDFGVYE